VKPANLVLKLAVVGSSCLLAGGFVSYRAGAFKRLTEPGDAPAMMPSSKLSRVFVDEQNKDGTESPSGSTDAAPPPTLMSGSKSILLPEAPPAERPPDTAKQAPPAAAPTVMPSSKSAPVFVAPPLPNTCTPPPASSERSKPAP
jgi:hypothetical protein